MTLEQRRLRTTPRAERTVQSPRSEWRCLRRGVPSLTQRPDSAAATSEGWNPLTAECPPRRPRTPQSRRNIFRLGDLHAVVSRLAHRLATRWSIHCADVSLCASLAPSSSSRTVPLRGHSHVTTSITKTHLRRATQVTHSTDKHARQLMGPGTRQASWVRRASMRDRGPDVGPSLCCCSDARRVTLPLRVLLCVCAECLCHHATAGFQMAARSAARPATA